MFEVLLRMASEGIVNGENSKGSVTPRNKIKVFASHLRGFLLDEYQFLPVESGDRADN